MRVLVLLALLAGVARAEEAPVDDYDPLVELRRSFEERDGHRCYDHLAVLRVRGVPDSTTINMWQRRDIPRGSRTLAELRVVCAKRMREHAQLGARELIIVAVDQPWLGPEACVQRWPIMIASGANPNERVTLLVHDRRRGGSMHITGTLEELYDEHCENAYTPRRRAR